ncbi:MAG TPA: thioredoxin family protein [Ramlibacter sp.]|jgi:thiol-disulfide isomerase/thioredoxin|nr:thioredoxin family protein [Ramlibacter sp.]
MDSADSSEQPQWWAVCLCAAWCGVCRDWLPLFRELSARHPHVRFAYVDVEDEDETMGDVDIETFPTVLIARGSQVMYLAPVPPMAKPFDRLLARLQAQPNPDPGIPADADGLFLRLKGEVLPRSRV